MERKERKICSDMKYIVTKDGRIAKYFPPIFPTCDNRIGYPSSKGLIFEEEILNQADTIEELCDEFVWNVKGSNKKIVANNIFPFSRIKLDLDKQFHNYELYGAIWTDKGLIYVAKMNDKGELELI